MGTRISRRAFVKRSGISGALAWVAGPRVLRLPRTEKLNVACFGIGGRGWGNTNAVRGENIIALCDPDAARGANAVKQIPDAPLYSDYREVLEKYGDKLDAVTVSTPDHMHAPISVAAMRRGLHCYCEKPLTWSVEEARLMTVLAKEKNLATQMGNQGTSRDGFRAGVEALQADIIGPVREVHIWSNRPVWPQGLDRPTGEQQVPETLDWESWLGCADERPYHPAYLPFKWRGWFDFGAGALGDMACHTMNLTYMGLQLGQPTQVSAETTEPYEETFPAGSKVLYKFPARGDKPAVDLHWYDGKIRPSDELMKGKKLPGSGCLLIGELGTMFSPDDYGERNVITMFDGSTPKAPEPTLPRGAGHHLEWLDACKNGTWTLSGFRHAGPFTEAVQLGNVALRTGKTLKWDAESMSAEGVPEAQALIRRSYRSGYSIHDPA